MSSLLPKGKTSTIVLGGILVVALLIGTFLFGYLGLRLLLGNSGGRERVAQAPTVTATVPASPTSTRTPTPTRTPLVIVAATAVPFTPGPITGAPERTPEPALTPSPPGGGQAASRTPTSTAASPGSQGTNKLPQTGFGPGVPMVGLILAGMAGAARWLRQHC